jgi:hypothetical protein
MAWSLELVWKYIFAGWIYQGVHRSWKGCTPPSLGQG